MKKNDKVPDTVSLGRSPVSSRSSWRSQRAGRHLVPGSTRLSFTEVSAPRTSPRACSSLLGGKGTSQEIGGGWGKWAPGKESGPDISPGSTGHQGVGVGGALFESLLGCRPIPAEKQCHGWSSY